MKKVVVVLVLFLVAGQVSKAQSFFSAQWEVAEPTESFRKVVGTGYGAKGTYFYFSESWFALTASVGYVKWEGKPDSLSSRDYKFISVPVKAGLVFLLSKNPIAPYLGLSLGIDYLRIRGSAPNSAVNTYADQSELKFGFSPFVGIGIHVAGPVGIMLNGSYNVIYTDDSPAKYFGLNAGLAVGF